MNGKETGIYSQWHAIHTGVYIHNGILFSHEKEWNPVICDIMDGSGDHYIKGNKLDAERQVPHDFTHVESEKVDLIKVESKLVITRG
jgi:hypothetical protein